MLRNHEKGRCSSDSFFRFPNHAFNPTHKRVACKMIVYMMCYVFGDDSDDRIRTHLLHNFDTDSHDDEASIEKLEDDEGAIEKLDEKVDIKS